MIKSLKGSGIKEDPYIIEDIESLRLMKLDLGAHYELKQNIEPKQKNEQDMRKRLKPIGCSNNPFTGTLQGNGYAIRDIRIEEKDTEFTTAGLFGYVTDNASIKDLKIDSSYVCGSRYVGCLAGKISGDSYVSNVMITNTNIIKGRKNVGGVTGCNKSSNILESCARPRIHGIRVGGIAGKNNGEINSTYSIPTIYGCGFLGSILGVNGSSGRVKNSWSICQSHKTISSNKGGNKNVSNLKIIDKNCNKSLENPDILIKKPNIRYEYNASSKNLIVQQYRKLSDQYNYIVDINPRQVQMLVNINSEYVKKVTPKFKSMVVANI